MFLEVAQWAQVAARDCVTWSLAPTARDAGSAAYLPASRFRYGFGVVEGGAERLQTIAMTWSLLHWGASPKCVRSAAAAVGWPLATADALRRISLPYTCALVGLRPRYWHRDSRVVAGRVGAERFAGEALHAAAKRARAAGSLILRYSVSCAPRRPYVSSAGVGGGPPLAALSSAATALTISLSSAPGRSLRSSTNRARSLGGGMTASLPLPRRAALFGTIAANACRASRLTVSSFVEASVRSWPRSELGTRIVRTSSLFGAGAEDRCNMIV